jgi:hypothetical protein
MFATESEPCYAAAQRAGAPPESVPRHVIVSLDVISICARIMTPTIVWDGEKSEAVYTDLHPNLEGLLRTACAAAQQYLGYGLTQERHARGGCGVPEAAGP